MSSTLEGKDDVVGHVDGENKMNGPACGGAAIEVWGSMLPSASADLHTRGLEETWKLKLDTCTLPVIMETVIGNCGRFG